MLPPCTPLGNHGGMGVSLYIRKANLKQGENFREGREEESA